MAQVLFVSYIDLDANHPTTIAAELAAQRAAVAAHLERCGGGLIAELREIRLGGFEPARAELQKALALCQREGAVLLVARLERLARNHAFLASLRRDLERLDLRFRAADMPEASEATIGILAAVAAFEPAPAGCGDCRARQRDFLARLGDRPSQAGAEPDPDSPGTIALGATRQGRTCMPRTLERAMSVAPVLAEIRAAGATTFEQVAYALNELGIPSARGDRWYPSQVRRVEQRIAARA